MGWDAYFGLKDYDKALLFYDKAINIDSQNINGIIGKGNIFLKLRSYDHAFLQYEKALFFDPISINALQGKGQVYVNLGENKMAAEIFQQIEIIKNTNLKKIDKIKDTMLITETQKIPNWVRTVFKWFSEDLISEDDVILALEFLVKNGIIKIDLEESLVNPAQ